MSHSPELFGMLAIFALIGTVIVIVMWIIFSKTTGFNDRLAEQQGTPRSQGKWFCRYCGRDIDASSAFCCYCGCDLN